MSEFYKSVDIDYFIRYQWEKSDDSPKAGDMLGTTTPVLKLANLVEVHSSYILRFLIGFLC